MKKRSARSEDNVGGRPNKTIAAALGMRMKTLEVRRTHSIEKVAVDSMAELTALYLAFGLRKGKP